jgi:hypothetical protein
MRAMLFILRFNRAAESRRKKESDEAYKKLCIWAANRVGFNWKRRMELSMLGDRFKLRKKALGLQAGLVAEREKAEHEKKLAEEDVKKTNDLLEMTINASWKQGSDPTGKN